MMIFPVDFHGRIGRLPYGLLSAAFFFSQHVVTLATFRWQGAPFHFDWWFAFIPLRSLVTQPEQPVLLLGFAYMLAVAWALAALAYRRAVDADINEWIAAAAIAPFLQIAVIAYLSVLPTRSKSVAPAAADGPGDTRVDLAGLIYGVIACVGVTIIAVALSTLIFSVYGFGLFVFAPFVIGAITAFLVNAKSDIGAKRTNQLLAVATAIGAIGLVAVALEGIICIVLVAPLAFGLAVLGGMMGRAIAISSRRPARQFLSGFALLPVMFALESLLPAETSFATQQAITVNAPPEAVWASLLHMETIETPPALPFRLGVAHPIRGDVIGEGIGALRHGEFSTGIAIERVTEWEPNRKLAFVVEQDVPSMRELSPYHHVHAPHAVGYFRTSLTSFDLTPRPDGGTDIVERTTHQLRLEPVLYWLPMARWIVRMNNERVLSHVKHQAERATSRERAALSSADAR